MKHHHPTLPDPQAPPPGSETLPENALVPVASRHDGWTPTRQRMFIETLADTACVKAAAQAAGMTAQSAFRLRRRADAQAFNAAWSAALEQGLERLVTVAIDRAINGTMRERYYRGELIAEERVHHNGLLMALIKRGQSMLGHARARDAIREDWDGAMGAIEAGVRDARALTPDPYAVWDFGGMQVTNCPPGPDHQGFMHGSPYSDGYIRQLTLDEVIGRLSKRGYNPDVEEDKRRAMFGLDEMDDPGAAPRRARRAAAASADRSGAPPRPPGSRVASSVGGRATSRR